MAKGKDRRKRQRKERRRRAEQEQSVRALERHLAEVADAQRALRKRLKRLARRLDAGPPLRGLPAGPPGSPGLARPPWVTGPGPVVSLEVPLETDDPAAPLWATVAARLPEEVSAVDDDGRVVRFRYSAVGSTPQAPRYRRLADPPGPPSPTP